MKTKRKPVYRKIQAGWRDTLLLLKEFWLPLFMFFLLVIGGGGTYYLLAQRAGESIGGLGASIYHVLSLIFFQPMADYPQAWYLQLFYYILPFLGLGILALGVTDFASLLFNRRARGKEWEMAVASTFSKHVVLVGLGHLGYRVVKQLRELDEDVVVVELSPDPDLLASVHRLDVPVIEDDASREVILEAAGIRRAKAILLCTQNDSLNLQIALKARNLNPQIQVVVRIFDDDFAEALRKQFGFRALSATGMAAPVFAATAVEIDITPPIVIAGQPNSLARIEVSAQSKLIGLQLCELEQRFDLSVVMQSRSGESDVHPAGTLIVQAGDILPVLGKPEQINRLAHQN